MDTLDTLADTADRLERASELALSGSTQRSADWLAALATVDSLSRDLARGHSLSAQTVAVLARAVGAVADRCPTASVEQQLGDEATVTLDELAGLLEEEL